MADLIVKVYDPTYTTPRATTLTGGVLGEDWGRQFFDPLNDVGAFRLNLQNDDPDLALIGDYDVVRFEVGGVAAWDGIVEPREVLLVDPGEEVGQFTTLIGRGLVAEWERACWHPDGGVDRIPWVDTRIFNFACFDFDDSSWAAPSATDPKYFEADQRFGWPEGWPNQAAEWIWDRDASATGVPEGACYFRREFTLASDFRGQLWCAADDEYEVWLDGGLLFEETGFYTGQCKRVELDMDAGDHVIAVKVNNRNNLRAGLLFTMISKATNGTYDTVLTASNTTNWKVVSYPGADPGMTPGEIIRIFLEEAQARGLLPGWTLDFTDTLDSDGVAWPTNADVAFPVGTDGLSMLRQLAEAYIDFDVQPGAKVLRAYVPAGLGQSRAVTLTTSNLGRYVARAEPPMLKTLLSRYQQGYTADTDAAATVDAEGFLSLGQVRSAEEVGRIATKLLQQYRGRRTGAEFTLQHTNLAAPSPLPWVDFFKGDHITAPDETGVAVSMRVRSLAYEEDDGGKARYDGELGDAEGEVLERIERWLRRMAGGTVGGRVESAGPPVTGGQAPPGQTRQALQIVSFPGAVTSGVISGNQTVPFACRLVLAILKIGNPSAPPTSATTVRIYIDNTAHTDLTFSTNATAEAEFVSIDLRAGQSFKIGVPVAGAGLSDFTFQPQVAA